MTFFGTRMAKLKFENEALRDLLEEKEAQVAELKSDRNEWRKKFELSVHTPEYKLDAEAAFNRGYQHAIRMLKTNLMFFIDQLPQDKQENAEV